MHLLFLSGVYVYYQDSLLFLHRASKLSRPTVIFSHHQ